MDSTLAYMGEGYGNGPNPAADQGSVVVNGALDISDVLSRLGAAKVKGSSTFYRGDTDKEVYSIMRGEVLLTPIRNKYARLGPDPSSYPVVSSLNWYGKGTDTLSQVEESFAFGGISKGDVHFETSDGTGRRFNDTVACQIGGIVTISNTGPKKIARGDYVMWKLPDPTGSDTMIRPYATDEGKIVPQTVPYDRDVCSLTVQSIAAHVEEVSDSPKFPYVDPSVDPHQSAFSRIKSDYVDSVIRMAALIYQDCVMKFLPTLMFRDGANAERMANTLDDITTMNVTPTAIRAAIAAGGGGFAASVPHLDIASLLIHGMATDADGLTARNALGSTVNLKSRLMESIMEYLGVSKTRTKFSEGFIKANRVRIANMLFNPTHRDSCIFDAMTPETDVVRDTKVLQNSVMYEFSECVIEVERENSRKVFFKSLSDAEPSRYMDGVLLHYSN